MAKRFIDTKIWDKAWFRRLTPKNKLVWIYLLTRCDHAGIWDADWEAAEFLIGEGVEFDELPEEIKVKMEYIEGKNQYFMPSFIEFQYGELREKVAPHKSVIKRLTDKKLLKSIKSVPITLKDKDKDISKGKEEREREFFEACKLIQEKHEASDEMINQFVNHWTESNKSGRLMKFEMQKTFDISRRLAKWKANDLEWNIESQKNKKSFLSRFKKTPTGYWKAYCSRCNKKELPNNEWQLRQGSSCCAVDYMPEKVNA